MLKQLLSLSLLTVNAFAAEAVVPVPHVINFGAVNTHLFRGAEPSDVGLTELGAAGVTMVIDLREAGPGTQFEKQETEKLGMKYTNIPFRPLSAPTSAQMRTVLNLLAANQTATIFVHCRRGKDRTGTVIACYRIQHDGWDSNHALAEAKRFGMSPVEQGMKAFILHFTPELSPSDSAILSR